MRERPRAGRERERETSPLRVGLETRATAVATERLVRGDRGPVRSYRDLPPTEWSAETTKDWMLSAENGRFAHVVLPPGATANSLLAETATNLAALFEGDGRAARQDREGAMWTLSANELRDNLNVVATSRERDIGRALYASLRREMCRHVELPSGR